MASRTHEMDMCSGPLFKKILIFALPIMAMNLLQLLFNAADMIVVGQFVGSAALAAVGATGALISLIVNLFMGLSVGTSVVVAQDYGAGNPEAVSRSVHTSIAVSIVSGIVVMTAGIVLGKPLLMWMGTPADVIDMSALYIQIYFAGVPAAMIYNFGAAILRAVGDSRHTMYYLIIGGIVNVILNVIFVTVFGMTVDGVAWATVISQYLSAALTVICLVRCEGAIRLNIRRVRIDGQKLKSIVKIGLPAGLQSLLFSVSNVLIQSALNSFGSVMLAASSASGNVEGLVGTCTNAYYNAAVSFSGQNMGAGKHGRIDTVAKVCTALIFATWLVLGGGVILFGRPLLYLYTSEAAVVDLGMQRLVIMMGVYFSCGIMNVFPGLTRGMGYSILPMICTLIGNCLLRIVWLGTVFTWYPTMAVLFACYPVTWTLAGIGQVGCFLYARRRIREKAAAAQEAVLQAAAT